MAKSKEELNELKNECESLANKLTELTDDELKQVCAGEYIWDIAVKLKEKFNIFSNVNSHGDNKKPTMPLWDDNSNNPK